jgi:uncharacterized protein YndB with AHSA1/START domain
MKSTDAARVTTFVALTPAEAFEVFTAEIDHWWKKAPRFRPGGQADGALRFEDGRLVEVSPASRFEVGRVLAWEPGQRLMFEWRAHTFAPGELTEVEVRFEPLRGGTQVTLEHRGWDALPAEHRGRHGLDGSAFTAMIGLWWGDLVTSFRAYAAAQP